MKNTALITGASSGIGLELAKIHSSKGGDLVIVARNIEKLNQLQKELEDIYQTEVLVIQADLSQENAYKDIFKITSALNIEIDILINNAGFGYISKFYESNLERQQKMIEVNIKSLMSLTHIYLDGMIKRKRGKILNVSSTAGFIPGPLQSVYYASKSFVNSFSQAISQEVKEHKITVTALCPGPVDTNFSKVASPTGKGVWKNSKTAISTARCGYKAMEQGKLIAINQVSLSFALNWIIPFLPRRTVLKNSYNFMKKAITQQK